MNEPTCTLCEREGKSERLDFRVFPADQPRHRGYFSCNNSVHLHQAILLAGDLGMPATVEFL